MNELLFTIALQQKLIWQINFFVQNLTQYPPLWLPKSKYFFFHRNPFFDFNENWYTDRTQFIGNLEIKIKCLGALVSEKMIFKQHFRFHFRLLFVKNFHPFLVTLVQSEPKKLKRLSCSRFLLFGWVLFDTLYIKKLWFDYIMQLLTGSDQIFCLFQISFCWFIKMKVFS